MAQILDIPGIELGAELGRGAQSVVYRGTCDGREVAIKISRQDGRDELARTVLGFRREAAALARSRHPVLVEIFDVGEVASHAYLVMEYVRGKSLATWLEQNGPMAEGPLLKMALGLASCLSSIQRQNLVHRDIKPQNILVTEDGGVKLIDFGFAAQAESEKSESEMVVGTFLYSAPEQSGALNRPVDGRSDLYSLGVVLYECVTGTPPFVARDVGELIHKHANEAPATIREKKPQIGAATEAVILKLLSKDPDDRYPAAASLAADLELIQQGLEPRLGAETLDRPGNPIFGRQKELEDLRARWAASQSGRGSIILVEGEPGSGKSRLIQELVADARDHGAMVLRGKCSAANSLPFSALREALDRQLIRMHGERDKVLKAAGNFAPLLKRFSPAFSLALADIPESSSAGEVQDAFYTALAEFIAGLAGLGAPLVFVIDDVQWLDEGSRQVLVRLAPLLEKHPLLIATSSRSDPASVQGRDRFVALVQRWLTLRLQLGPLPEAEVAKIISATLGGYDVEDTLLKQISTRANGSPLAVGEYVRAMLDAGLLRPKWGTWHADSEGLERLELPTDVVQLIVRRIADLTDGTKGILKIAALLGTRFSIELLAVSSQAEPPAIQAAIQEATAANLLENVGRGEYVFVHDRVLEAFFSLLDPEQTKKTHQRIAEAMDRKGTEGGADRLYAMARHFARGEIAANPERAMVVNRDAGMQALENFANEEAFAFFSVARGIAGEFGVQAPADLDEHLGIAATLTNRKDEAVSSFERAIGSEKDPLKRGTLYGRIARIYVLDRRLDLSEKNIRQALSEMRWRFPSNTGWDWLRAVAGFLSGYLLSKLHLLRGSARGKRREALTLKAQLYELCMLQAYFAVNYPLSVQMSLGPWRINHLLGTTREASIYFSTLSVVAGVLKRFKSYERLHALSKKIALDMGDPNLYGRAVGWGAIGAAFMGIGRDADVRANQALEEYGNVLPMDTMANVAGTLIWNNLVRGYVGRSRDFIIRTCRQAAARSGRAAVFDEKNPEYLIESWRSFEIAGIAMTRPRADLNEHLALFEAKGITTPFTLAAHYANRVLIAYEHDDYGDAMENAIRLYRAMKITAKSAPISARHFFIFQAYVRLEQAFQASPDKQAPLLAAVEQALKELSLAAGLPMFRSHYLAIRGALRGLQGNRREAYQDLADAEAVGREADSPVVQFDVCRFRAMLLKKDGNESACSREAKAAYRLASDHGWIHRARKVRHEFAIEQSTDNFSASQAGGSFSTTQTGVSAGSFDLQRQLDALLQLSAASAVVSDPDEVAKVALDEIVRLLGAERAFLFMAADGADGALKLKAGRDAAKNDLAELKGYSSTVVGKVMESQQALVVSGTEEGALLGSTSAMAHNLRSIMAAPLKLRDRILGVVYLDSRVARGIFTQGDVAILGALGNYIAIAIETARARHLEIEKQNLEKDLKVKKAIQTILDNLDQGFMTFDESGTVQEGVSRAARELWGIDPAGKPIAELIGRGDPKINVSAIRDWAGILFQELMPFEDMKDAGPRVLPDPQGRHIELDFRAVREDSGKLEKVIVVSTDRTQEMKFRAQARAESAKVQMILAILGSKSSFAGFLRETRAHIEAIRGELERAPGEMDLVVVFRMAHSLKGGAASFHLLEIAELAHELETQLAIVKEAGSAEAVARSRQLIDRVQTELEAFLERYREVLGSAVKSGEPERAIPLSWLQQMASQLSDSLGPGHALVTAFYERFVLESLDRQFEQFIPVVRNTASQLGKEAELKIDAAPIRARVEGYSGLISSMVHAMRNAVDHGIEMPAEREANGKPKQGTIRLSFEKLARQGGTEGLRIALQDDGKGIDPAVIGKLAVEKGIVGAEAVKALSADQIIQFVFAPGFSSKAEVTAISGRGVGMDAIQAEAHALGGKAWIESKPGKGARLVIDLPLLGREALRAIEA